MRKTITLPAGAQRLTISDVLKIINQAFAGSMIRVDRREDGSLLKRVRPGAGPVGNDVKQQFLAFCESAQVVPTSPFDRWRHGYTGNEPDDIYEVTVDEFRRFVTPFGLTVEVADVIKHAVRPVQAQAAQEEFILTKLVELKYSPSALPKNKPGHDGPKAEVRSAIGKNRLFQSVTVFDKAWARLRADGRIANA